MWGRQCNLHQSMIQHIFFDAWNEAGGGFQRWWVENIKAIGGKLREKLKWSYKAKYTPLEYIDRGRQPNRWREEAPRRRV